MLRPGRAREGKERSTQVPDALLHQARKSGQLNLSNRGLEKVPVEVLKMRDHESTQLSFAVEGGDEGQWWGQVDLTKLILACNRISHIPDDIVEFSSLQVLDLHDNQLVLLPSRIGELKELRRLAVGHNQLVELPGEMSSLVNLVLLHLEHNKLTRLGEYLQQLEQLEELNVSYNQLADISTSLGCITRLRRLNMSHNRLVEIPSTLCQLKSLQDVDASGNKLTEFPSISGLDKLERLNLQHNNLTKLPSVCGCSSLKEVYLGNNRLQQLPGDWLKSALSVVLLDLRDNKIHVIPVEITLLVTLERFDVTNNHISSLPCEMGNMSTLKSILLDGNPLRALRRDVVQKGTQAILKYLKSRIAAPVSSTEGTTESSKLPSTTGSLKSSKRLILSGQKMDVVPDDTVSVIIESGMESVDISRNNFSSLPSWIWQLKSSLTDLNVANNKLTAICPEISCCVKLTRLSLSNNSLVDLPDMQPLSCLLELALSHNRFQQIPSTVYQLVGLETLIANDNQICDINVADLQQLPKLVSLDLQNNNIHQVPPELGLLPLRSLQLSGNPFRVPRPALLAKGTQSLLQYLKDRIPSQ